jgi:hypothetical protein
MIQRKTLASEEASYSNDAAGARESVRELGDHSGSWLWSLAF